MHVHVRVRVHDSYVHVHAYVRVYTCSSAHKIDTLDMRPRGVSLPGVACSIACPTAATGKEQAGAVKAGATERLAQFNT